MTNFLVIDLRNRRGELTMGLAISVLTASGLLLGFNDPQHQTGGPRRISAEEAKDVMGGVGVTSYSAYTSSPEDNVSFDIDFNTDPAYWNSQQQIAIFASGTKMQTTWVNAPNGTWKTRTLWPVSGYKTFQFKWWDASSNWTTTYSGGTHRVDPDIHMVDVRIWNTTIDGVTTAATPQQFTSLIDNLNFNYSWNSTNSVDAIYAQCSTAKTMQLRFKSMQTITLSQCDYPFPALSGSPPYWGLDTDCVDEMVSDTTASGALTLNVVVVNNMPERGWHIRGASSSNPTWHVIAVQEGWVSDAGFIRTLAHEIGHWMFYPDSSAHSPTYNCGQGGEPACGSDTAKCGMRLSGGVRVLDCNANNNVMCGTTASACGRAITSTQCTDSDNDRPSYYVDVN